MDKVLLHICCGPCAAGSLPQLRRKGLKVEGFFFNPNIHPVTELRYRLEALKDYSIGQNIPLTVREDYGLVNFIRTTAYREEDRCEHCYVTRLRESAREAQRRGIRLFTTTLLFSIYQKHNLLKDIAEQVGREFGVEFLYLDLRKGWEEGRRIWRETGLYAQKYCGCIYSEMERYLKGTGRKPKGARWQQQNAGIVKQ